MCIVRGHSWLSYTAASAPAQTDRALRLCVSSLVWTTTSNDVIPRDTTKSHLQVASRKRERTGAIAIVKRSMRMTMPRGSPQSHNTTKAWLHQELEVTSSIHYAWRDDMAVAPSMPSSASQMRAMSRSRTALVTTWVVRRLATESQAVRVEFDQMMSVQMHFNDCCQCFDNRAKRHMIPRSCYDKRDASV